MWTGTKGVSHTTGVIQHFPSVALVLWASRESMTKADRPVMFPVLCLHCANGVKLVVMTFKNSHNLHPEAGGHCSHTNWTLHNVTFSRVRITISTVYLL